MQRLAVLALAVALWLAPSAVAARAATPCAPDSLSGVAILHGTSWMLVGSVTVRNEGGAACSLPARPAVAVEWRGERLALKRVAFPSGYAALTSWRSVRILRPGATATVFVAWTSWCGPRRWASRFSPTLAVASGGGELPVPVSQPVAAPRCNGAGRPGALGSTGFLTP